MRAEHAAAVAGFRALLLEKGEISSSSRWSKVLYGQYLSHNGSVRSCQLHCSDFAHRRGCTDFLKCIFNLGLPFIFIVDVWTSLGAHENCTCFCSKVYLLRNSYHKVARVQYIPMSENKLQS